MTTYYVKNGGDNAKDGLSDFDAWETIAYAMTQMVAYDTLIIAAGTYSENADISTDHITLIGAGSGSTTTDRLYLMASYPICSGITTGTLLASPGVTNISLDDIVCETNSAVAGLDAATINNCDFTGFALILEANAPAFTNCTFRVATTNTLAITTTFALNATFENTTIIGDPSIAPPFDAGIYIKFGTNTVFTNTTFDHPENAIKITEGGTATFIQQNNKVLVGTVGTNTVTPTESTLVVADGTYDYRDFTITPDGSIVVTTSLWETTGNKNKAWKVEATGDRTVTFQLGDMLASTRYNLLADDTKVATATSDSAGVISFDYTGSFSEKTFTTASPPPTHDEIRSAAIAALQTDSTINAAIKTWLKYLIDTGKITYPAIYIGTIIQPLDGACGTDTQHTSIADPMKITVGVLSNTHTAATTELGTLYELVYAKFKATPELGLNNFRVHHISPIITKPIPKCGRSIIRAEMTLNATWEE